MKMYKVFECEGHRFTYAGGCLINVYEQDRENEKIDTIEFYETYDDSEVARLCLDWLEEAEVIEEAKAYYF
tara:strand:+ start:436 stop:648 length:213 start_codon:yes stop_codon:yes gene_type:complete